MERIDTKIRGLRRYEYPGPGNDHLYQADYNHTDRRLTCLENRCDAGRRVNRPADGDDGSWVTVHRGTIASGEVVTRNGLQRDRLARRYDVLCFEMEAAGALNDLPCLVIRGISDYADSHKNDVWQGYAAAVAAAYARQLFSFMPIDPVTPGTITTNDGSAPSAAIPPMSESVVAVARAGTALRTAVNSGITRRQAIAFIVKLEDAMLLDMRTHASSAQWANDSDVKFYFNVHMRSDPIAPSFSEYMVQALEKSMERVMIVNPEIPKEHLFGGFEAQSLRTMT